MKKLVWCLLSLLLILTFLPQVSYAATNTSTNVSLVLNGITLLPDVPAQKVDGYVMVPLRIISQNFGASVAFSPAEQKVTVTKEGTIIELFVNKKTALINSQSVILDAAPILISGRALVPARFVANQMGIDVKWIQKTQTVILSGSVLASPEQPTATPTPEATPTPSPTPTATPSPTPTDVVVETPGVTVLPEAPPSAMLDPNGESGTLPEGTSPNSNQELNLPHLTGITVVNNLVTVTGDAPFAPKVSYVANPNPQRIVLDITGMTFSDQFPKPTTSQEGLIVVDHPTIQQIRYSLFDPATQKIRVVIDLKANSGFKIIQDGSTSTFILELTEYKLKIVIDAGHGDSDPGAISITNRKEKDFNLAVALKVKALLDQLAPVEAYLTRSDDTFVTLDGRAEFANNLSADAFISIHGNYFTKTSVGTESYY
ncbi:MAG: N-acetylmuramoyl-L-alanine amidase family protein, partial [Gorillibacterium sp.]|nr:N-acetylmuramoyl-L-alanine amidase family protein [Gorillibacterium sp.]